MIEVRNCKKVYRMGSASVSALNNVSLTIQDNTFTSIIGKSGSGKSTLLNIIGGLDTVSDGDVRIDNINICDLSEKKLSIFRRKNIGFVFQFFNLLPELTLKENIIFPTLMEKNKIDHTYYNYLIETLELKERQNHLPTQLSGGQQQRAAIARALILKPKFVLLDEPTGNLDEESSDKVVDMLCTIKRDTNQTVIFVTHDNDIAKRSDVIIKLKDGCVLNE